MVIQFTQWLIDWVNALIEASWWKHVEALPAGDEAKQEAVYICQLAKEERRQEMVDALKDIYDPNSLISGFGYQVIEWLQQGLPEEIWHRAYPHSAKKQQLTVFAVATRIRKGERKLSAPSLEDADALIRWVEYCQEVDGKVTPERFDRERTELRKLTGKRLSEINSMPWKDFVDSVLRRARQPARPQVDAATGGSQDPAGGPKTIWYHGGISYSVDGKSPIEVSQETHNVLRAFLNDDEARSTRILEGAGVSNVTSAINKIVRKFGDDYVRRPTRKGEGYFIRVRSLPFEPLPTG